MGGTFRRVISKQRKCIQKKEICFCHHNITMIRLSDLGLICIGIVTLWYACFISAMFTIGKGHRIFRCLDWECTCDRHNEWLCYFERSRNIDFVYISFAWRDKGRVCIYICMWHCMQLFTGVRHCIPRKSDKKMVSF